MGNDLRRRLKALEATAASVVTISAAEIAAAVSRYSAEGASVGCPSADAFGTMLRSMRPGTARLFLTAHPLDLML